MVKYSRVNNKMKMIVFVLLGLINAQDVPMLINYQAKLVGNNDTPINGTVQVTFRLYGTLNNGSSIWNETHSSLVSNNGIVSVLLGSVSPLQRSHFDNSTLYIETEVTGYGILSPRQRITSAPFAIKAENTYKLFVANHNAPSFQGNPGGEGWTILDTSFSAGSINEFIRVEVSEPQHSGESYREGFKCRVSAGINGQSLTNYGDIVISNSPYFRNSAGDFYFNYNPQAFWVIPITASLLNQEIQIQIKAWSSGLTGDASTRGDPTISIWGK